MVSEDARFAGFAIEPSHARCKHSASHDQVRHLKVSSFSPPVISVDVSTTGGVELVNLSDCAHD
jgi:hypothetical protein